MQFDELLEELNGFGRYQWFLIFISALPWASISFNHLMTVFVTAKPPFVCAKNTSHHTVPHDFVNASQSDQCRLYDVAGNISDAAGNTSVACETWTYDKTLVGSTIVSEVTVIFTFSLFHIHYACFCLLGFNVT